MIKLVSLNSLICLGSAGYSTFDSTPTTFLLASGIPDDAEWTEFLARYKDI